MPDKHQILNSVGGHASELDEKGGGGDKSSRPGGARVCTCVCARVRPWTRLRRWFRSVGWFRNLENDGGRSTISFRSVQDVFSAEIVDSSFFRTSMIHGTFKEEGSTWSFCGWYVRDTLYSQSL